MFSVVIPVYNKKPHIRRCLDSVLHQSYSHFEVIIVDDNSTDGSLKEVRKYNDPRIQVYRRSDPGPGGYAARNLGIKKAKYDWIAFLDADDEWYPNHLENIIETIKKFPDTGIIGAGFKSVFEDHETIQTYFLENYSKGSHRLSFSKFLNIYLRNKRFGNTSVVVVKKEIIKKVGGFPAGKTNKGGDLYTWIKVFAKSDGAWSPHIGANTYHDAVNKVTHTSYFNINFLKSIPEELSISNSNKALLKKYINSLILKDYIRYINNSNKRGFFLLSNVFYIEARKMIFYLALDVTPTFLIKKLLITRRSLKE